MGFSLIVGVHVGDVELIWPGSYDWTWKMSKADRRSWAYQNTTIFLMECGHLFHIGASLPQVIECSIKMSESC